MLLKWQGIGVLAQSFEAKQFEWCRQWYEKANKAREFEVSNKAINIANNPKNPNAHLTAAASSRPEFLLLLLPLGRRRLGVSSSISSQL